MKLYDKSQFVNHAKFFIGFHFCNYIRFSCFTTKYYGSTNFTIAGLSSYGSCSRRGNYEEFYFRRAYLERMQKRSLYYVSEVYNVVKERYGLYNDPKFLRQYYEAHLNELERLKKIIELNLEINTLAKLFQTYIDVQALYLQLLSFISDLPGRELTTRIIEETEKLLFETGMEPPDPLTVEALMVRDEESAENLAKSLEFSKENLRDLTRKYLDMLTDTLVLLKERYQPENVREYFDYVEKYFVEYLGEYGKIHLEILEYLRNVLEEGKG